MFKTYRPNNLHALLDIINDEKCHIFAGGTDLMIRKRQWQGAERKFTQSVVYISHLRELKGIKEYKDHYEIGTLTTQAEMVNSQLPDYLKTPYHLMATPAIRNVATVGGNIVNAASVADSLPVLYALDAEIELRSIEGKRVLKVEDFVLGKYKTMRASNEILTKVIIPKYHAKGYFYRKVGQRKASILSKVSIFGLHKEGDIRLAVGALNEKVIRQVSIEKALVENRDIEACLHAYLGEMQARDDKRSTKSYREQVALNLLESYLKEVIHEL